MHPTDLHPKGRLRAGLNLSNFLLVIPGTERGDPQGIAPDLAREIARRLGVPVEFRLYRSAGDMADAAGQDVWDVGFMGAEPAREGEIAFTDAYLEIEAGYLVAAGSPIRMLAEVDRPGVRIATYAKSAYDLYLTRTLQHATLVRAPSIDASFDLFVKEKLDALSGLKPRLIADAERLPGARVLEGRFTAIQQAIATPRSRAAGAAFLRAFAEEAKRDGLVARLIHKHGVRGVSVSPGNGRAGT